MSQDAEVIFKPGDLVRHKRYRHVGLVLENLKSRIFPLGVNSAEEKDIPSPHDPIKNIIYYRVLINGRTGIYSSYYLELVTKGENNE